MAKKVAVKKKAVKKAVKKSAPKKAVKKTAKRSMAHLDKWRKHLETVRKANPTKSLMDCMKAAKKTYKK